MLLRFLQIVSSICEFVETSTSDIGSGWRSLFGTLKAVRFPMTLPCGMAGANESGGVRSTMTTTPTTTTLAVDGSGRGPTEQVHWRAVLDVFEAFLGTENPQVQVF